MIPKDLKRIQMDLCFNRTAIDCSKRWLPYLYALKNGEDVFPGDTFTEEEIESEIKECEEWLKLSELDGKRLKRKLTICQCPRRG